MSLSTFLQIFLLIDFFVMGILVVLAYRHAQAHFKPEKHSLEKSSAYKPNTGLPDDVIDHLLDQSKTKMEAVMNNSVAQLQENLGATSTLVNKQLEKLATDIVVQEMSNYKAELARLREEAKNGIAGYQQVVNQYEEEQRALLSKQIEAEKQQIIERINSKLADAVGSFLVETLGHNIDLGAQSTYLTNMLEEHKDEFIKDVSNGS